MLRRSPLRENSQRAPSPISPHPNSTLENSIPLSGQSGGIPSNTPPSTLAPGKPENDDVEKQLSGTDQAPPVESEVGPTNPQLSPLQSSQDAARQGKGLSATPDHLKNTLSNLDQYPDFWNVYNKEADREDIELIDGFGADLDTLLIFAGLFSAINTAFIIESYKDLKQDQSELTNNLLRNMMRTMHQSSFTEADLLLDYDGPPTRAIVVNLFFFASLCCSLFTAFGAVIGKQWLKHYGRESHLRSPSARGLDRQKKYMGLAKWRFQAVVETFPTLLQFSLFFFFIGLIDFMWPLNIAVGILIILFSIATLFFYVVTLGIGILYPNCPYQTRLTEVLRERLISKKPSLLPDNMDILRARCVDWLQQHTTLSETIGIISQAITLLTDEAKRVIHLDRGGAMLAYFLRSSVYNDRVHLGISAEGLRSSLGTLKDVISQWNKDTDIVHSGDTGNASFLEALSRELWNLLLEPGTMDEMASFNALAILEKLGVIKEGYSPAIRAGYLVESLAKPLSRQDQLPRLALLHDALLSGNSPISPDVTKSHILEVLTTTMWGEDKEPDLDQRRVALRLFWFLWDIDRFCSQPKDFNFARYLSLWRSSNVQPLALTSVGPRCLNHLYLHTVLRLLLHDQEKWAKELHEHGHLAHIEAISRDESLLSYPKLLCWMTLILFAYIAGRNDDPNAPPSQCYSQPWVNKVTQQLRNIRISLVRFLISELKPNQIELINQSLSGYIQTAHQYKRIPDNEFAEVYQLTKNVTDMTDSIIREFQS
ncbi:hypothetical protein FRC03_009689 [Tulasnella sp. 419]|nr:hypothetical protein FRC03_009689 [Tulasnella sp. 419]